jgi:hypothetical protein
LQNQIIPNCLTFAIRLIEMMVCGSSTRIICGLASAFVRQAAVQTRLKMPASPLVLNARNNYYNTLTQAEARFQVQIHGQERVREWHSGDRREEGYRLLWRAGLNQGLNMRDSA